MISRERTSAVFILLITFALSVAIARVAVGEIFTQKIAFRTVGLCCIGGIRKSAAILATDDVQLLIDEFSKLLPDDFPKDISELGQSVGITSIFSFFSQAVKNAASRMTAFFLMLVGIVVLFSLSEHSLSTLGKAYRSAISAVLFLPVAMGVLPFFERVGEAISSSSAFFAGVIPIASAVCAAGGLTSTAAAEAAGMNLTLGIVSGVVAGVILPLVSAAFGMALIGAVSENSAASRVSGGIKGVIGFLQGLVTTVIISSFACQSVVTTAADGMTMRGIKYAISGMIPVVGSTVSSSISFLVTGAEYAARVIGISSVLVILYGFGAVLVELIALRISFSLAISLSQFTGAKDAERGLCAMRGVTDSLMTVFVSVAILYVSEMIIFIGCAGRAYA